MSDGEILRQSNFTGGEADPSLKGRRDWKGYYSALETARNLVFQAQGGLLRRPALAFEDYVRGPIEPIDTAGAVVTAPNGGTAADGFNPDDSTSMTTTTNLSNTGLYVVLQIDLGAAKDISAVDVIDYAAVNSSGDTPQPPDIISYPFQFYPYYGAPIP